MRSPAGKREEIEGNFLQRSRLCQDCGKAEGSISANERGQKREKYRIHIVQRICHQRCPGGEVECSAYIHRLSIGMFPNGRTIVQH